MEILQGFSLAFLVFALFSGGGCVIALMDDLQKVVASGSSDWILSRIQGFGSWLRLTSLDSATRRLSHLWGWHDGGPSLWWPYCFDVGCFVGLQATETGGVGDKVFFLGSVDHHWWLSLGKMTTGISGCGTGSSYEIRHWIRLWDLGGLWFQFEFLIQALC
ncbi:hypothetical protein M0R45_035850 [Rubus argutus]|uniref:Transmembrane protein n=1 Tax=Rubus argutus TaxID=59490 RepID=A0AAW1VX73_RUBAR